MVTGLGHKLKSARERYEYTQEELALKVGISKNHLSAIERLFDALEREKKGRASGWLVVNTDTQEPYQSLKTLFRLAAKRAGILKPVTHHVLRHTYSTLLMQLEIPAEVRQRLMRR